MFRGDTSLTKDYNICRKTIARLIFITGTVNFDGSLEHVLKYSHDLSESNFSVIDYENKND